MSFKIRNFFSLKKIKESTKNVKSYTHAEEWIIKGENYANRNNLKEAIKCFDIAFNLDHKSDFALGDKALMLDKISNKHSCNIYNICHRNLIKSYNKVNLFR